jgi:hypothetical protein
MTIKSILNGALLAFVAIFPLFALAHSDIADEREVGNYKVVMSYFADGAWEDDLIGFNLYVYPKPDGMLITPDSGTVKIAKADGPEMYSGAVDVADPDAPGFVEYTFPDGGNYTMTFSLKVRGEQLPDVAFPLTVNAIPSDEAPAISTTATTSPKQIVRTASFVVILLLIGGGLFYLHRIQHPVTSKSE